MAQMIVRNIDDGVAERFRQKAKAAGKSTEQLVRDLMIDHVRPTKEELLERLDDVRRTTVGKAVIDPVKAIREDRDSDHGRA